MRALAIAATGMDAQQTNLEVIANNIANINTTGYKRSRAEFSTFSYQTERAKGIPNRPNQAVVPEGANIGLGVQTTAVRNIQIQGELSQTQNELDVALVGRGWFQIQMPDGTTAYTRAGSFNKSDTGQIVTADGNVLEPGITIPNNASNLVINESGAGLGNDRHRDDADCSRPVADRQLRQRSRPATDGRQSLHPDAGFRRSGCLAIRTRNGFAYMKQNYLGSSNVDPVKEITDLITAQRAYEMNSKVITTADDMAQIVSKDLK